MTDGKPTDTYVGLSPRTRGSHAVRPRTVQIRGPIPADAGEPTLRRSSMVFTGAYPRGRGGALYRLA